MSTDPRNEQHRPAGEKRGGADERNCKQSEQDVYSLPRHTGLDTEQLRHYGRGYLQGYRDGLRRLEHYARLAHQQLDRLAEEVGR